MVEEVVQGAIWGCPCPTAEASPAAWAGGGQSIIPRGMERRCVPLNLII